MTDSGGKKQVLVVGGGFGGLGCAHALANSDGASKMEVTLLSEKEYFSIGGTWQYVWTGRVPLEQTKFPLEQAQAQLPGVTIQTKAVVRSFDFEKCSLTLEDSRTLTYDFLVLAPGVVSDQAKIPGLSEAAIDVCNIDHAERARSELQAFIAKAKDAGDAKLLLLVAIGGVPYKCPPLPFEIACLLDHELRSAGVRDNVRLAISCPVPFPIGGPIPNPASESFLPLIAEKGIEWLPQHELVEVEKGDSKSKAKYANGVELETDAIFAIYPQRASDVFVSAGLTNPKGFIPADLQTHRLQGKEELSKNVFVVGDAFHAIMPKPNLPHPKAGEFAWQQGQVAAANICTSVEGADDVLPSFRGGRCVAETGGESGMDMVNDLTNVIINPSEGKPSMKCTPGPAVASVKMEWVNGYIEKLFGADARKFTP